MNVENSIIIENKLRSAISTQSRPPRSSPLSATFIFWWRAMLKFKNVPEQLFDCTGSPITFLLMFTYMFGVAIAGSTGEYLEFVLPGVLVMSVVFITMYTGMGINTDVKKGVFDRFRSMPIWQPAFLIGALLGDTIRYILASISVVGVGLIMGFRPDGGAVGVLMAILLLLVFSFSLSWVWISLGMVVRTSESLMMISIFSLGPLIFLSNAFVPLDLMPGWLETAVNINPITHLVSAMRGLMLNDVVAGDIIWVLIACVLLVAVFGPLTMYFYRRKG